MGTITTLNCYVGVPSQVRRTAHCSGDDPFIGKKLKTNTELPLAGRKKVGGTDWALLAEEAKGGNNGSVYPALAGLIAAAENCQPTERQGAYWVRHKICIIKYGIIKYGEISDIYLRNKYEKRKRENEQGLIMSLLRCIPVIKRLINLYELGSKDNKAIPRREALNRGRQFFVESAYLILETVAIGTIVWTISDSLREEPLPSYETKPKATSILQPQVDLPLGISSHVTASQKRLLNDFANFLDQILEKLQKDGIIINRELRLIIGLTKHLKIQPDMMANSHLREAVEDRDQNGGSVALLGNFVNNRFSFSNDGTIPLENRGGHLIINPRGLEEFLLKSVIYHEFSHFASWKVGQLDSLKVRLIPVYVEAVKRGIKAPGGFAICPSKELPAYLDQLEYVIDHAPDIETQKKTTVIVFLGLLNQVFGVFQILKKILEGTDIKILDRGNVKNASEIFEECYQTILNFEKPRIERLNKKLIHLGLTAINPSINVKDYAVLVSRYKQLYPDLPLIFF